MECELQYNCGFQHVWKDIRNKVDISVVTKNKFQALKDEVLDTPKLMLMKDSLVKHQDEEFRRKGYKKK